MSIPNRYITILVSLLITIVYGFGVVWIFEISSDFLETFSWSFIMLLPYAVGAIGNTYLMRRREMGAIEAILWPWAYCVGLFIAVLIGSLGLLFCFVLSVPLLFPAASFGGVTVWLLKKYPKAVAILLCITVMSPFLAEPVEARFDTPIATIVTHTYIDIDASKELIWDNIKAVSLISENEYRFNWLHLIGIPRPVEAELSYEGVGGVRTGKFENGLQFDETITHWQQYEEISFVIEESSQTLLPAPLNMIDGEYFDVLDGTYRLEELPNGKIRLHFISTHQLETRFNGYGGWWMDYVMRDLQNYILEIIKARVEGHDFMIANE